MEDYIEKVMERLNSGESKTIFKNISCVVIIGLTASGRKPWQEEDETRKDTSVVLILQEQSCTYELFKVIQDVVLLILLYRTIVIIPSNFFQYILSCRMCNQFTFHRQNLSNRQTVFFLLVEPMDKNYKDSDTIDLSVPRHA